MSNNGQSWEVICADCLDAMAQMPENSVDAIVTDPPYGLKFMGQTWDHGVPGIPFWQAALRVVRPGAHMLAFGGTRTYHRLVCAIEDAGWQIRDTLGWIHGQGFPKSLDVSKAIDRAAGAERQVIAPNPYSSPGRKPGVMHIAGVNARPAMETRMTALGMDKTPLTAPATPAAAQWEGWGTALKPALELICLARKPLEGTVAQNVLKHGTGAINVDGCRMSTKELQGKIYRNKGNNLSWGGTYGKGAVEGNAQGRWPANLIHDGSEEVMAVFPQVAPSRQVNASDNRVVHNMGVSLRLGTTGTRTPANSHADSGSAARFFYCAKASKAEREQGCEGLERRAVMPDSLTAGIERKNGKRDEASKSKTLCANNHPTVKPLALMRYLCRLVTPPGGLILDPFMGSGSTGKAAIMEGFRFIGIEINPEYVEIAKRRIANVAPLFAGKP